MRLNCIFLRGSECTRPDGRIYRCASARLQGCCPGRIKWKDEHSKQAHEARLSKKKGG